MNALACIVCQRELESCARPNQPLDGLSFSSRGAYGTTVFDPMDGSALEINVCDNCLELAGQRRQVLHYPAQQSPPPGWHSTVYFWGADEAANRPDADTSSPSNIGPGRTHETGEPDHG